MVETLPAREPFEILNGGFEPVRGDLRFRRGAGPDKPVVIVCHSFMAFKDWGFFPRVGEKLAEGGFASITFNFSRNGVAAGGSRITELDRFASNTFSSEVGDVGAIITAIREGRLGAGVADPGKIALLGHSRGGGIAILRTAIDNRIAALVTWSAVSTLDRWTERQKHLWRSEGTLRLARDTAASPLRLGLSLLGDLERNRDALDVLSAASRVGVPWLLLHGGADVTVPVTEAEALHAASPRPATEYVVLERVGHLYNAASERGDGYGTLDGVIKLTADWLHHILT
jgi:pimeloyl-ACP methyl ester carboxylesterase